MPEAKDTATEEVAETVAPEVNGTEVDESTATAAEETTVTPVDQTKADDPAEVEKLRKELNKAQMEINQRRNKEKELEEARKQAELDALEKEGKFQELAEQLKADAEAKAQDDQRKEAEAFRNKIIDSYPADVQEKARALNLYWDEANDFSTAETQLRAKLDILKPVVATSTAKDDTQIHPNNPSSLDMGKDFDAMSLDDQIAYLQKELGRAPAR